MSERVTFDRLKIRVPTEFVTVIDQSAFTMTTTGDGMVTRMKYEQTSPFYYNIMVDMTKQTSTVEFSGKALLDDYPHLIDSTNITTCIDNINACGVCYINTDEALAQAYVVQCDVTRDVTSTWSITDLYRHLPVRNNRQWCLRDITSNRFTLENTVVTKRKKVRMVVYDKEMEMDRSVNQPFLNSISNTDDQLAYYKNKVRFELNLNSLDRIRKYFHVSTTRLSAIFASNVDPIAEVLSEALGDETPLNNTKKQAGNLRELEHLLLMALCGFDMRKIELVVRDLYGSSRSIKRVMEPYHKLLAEITANVPAPENDLYFAEIRNRLRYMLSMAFGSAYDGCNLLRLYHSASENDADSIPP